MIQLTAVEKQVAKLLTDEYLFRIPDYQRPFSWGDDQVATLLTDFHDAMRRNPEQDYFLGSLVLIKAADRPNADVVDGQQRLTTLTIFLCVARDALGGIREADEVHEFVVQRGKKFTKTDDTYRLTLRARDQMFFRHAVQERGATLKARPEVEEEAQRRILSAVRTIRDYVGGLEPGELERLVAFVVQNCVLVAVSAENQETAFRIFEVMNNRGLPLAPSDILKAEIIGAAQERDATGAADCREIWEDVENHLGRAALQDLLANICIVRKRGKLEGTITASMRKLVDPAATPVAFMRETFQSYAEAFAKIVDPRPKGSGLTQPSAAALMSMNRLGNRDWQPVALDVVARFGEDPDLVERLLLSLERTAFFLALTGVYYNRRMSRYGEMLGRLVELDEVDPSNGEAFPLSPKEKAAMREVLEGDVYPLPNATRRALLLRLDSLLSDAPHLYDFVTLTVEHVLPQNPAQDGEWWRRFDAESHEAWVHRLANLILLAHPPVYGCVRQSVE